MPNEPGPVAQVPRAMPIIDPAYSTPGPSTTAEESQIIHLLGGLEYPAHPVFLKSRNTFSFPTNQENLFLKSRNSIPKKQEKERLQSRKTKSAEAASGKASTGAQERSKKIIRERTEEGPAASASVDLPQVLPPMPSSAPAGATYEEVLATLQSSAGWKADGGRDLLLLKHLQHYPVEWLLERAADYALADGTHTYQGFKNWCQSPRAQEKLRLWEQEQRARALRAANIQQARQRTPAEQEAEDARIVAERNARSRARFGPEARA